MPQHEMRPAVRRAILGFLFGIFLLTRLPATSKYLWYDLSTWGAEMFYVTPMPYTYHYIPHMPLGAYIYKLSTLVFGTTSFGMNLVPILFSIPLLYLVYAFARNIGGDEAGLFAAGISVLGFYPYLASIQVDMDGAIIALLLTSMLFLYHRERDSLRPRTAVAIGVLAAVIALLRLPVAFLALSIMGLHYLYEHRRLKPKRLVHKAWHSFWPVGIAFIAVFGVALLYLYSQIPETIINIIRYAGGSRKRDLTSILLLGYALVLMTPLVFGFLLRLGAGPKKEKGGPGMSLFLLWVGIYVLALLVAKGDGDLPRYFTPAIPALCILTGTFLAERYRERALDLRIVLGGAIAVLLVLICWTLLVPFAPPANASDLLARLLGLRWNFLFVYFGSSMLPIYVPFLAVLCTYGLALLGGLLFMLTRRAHGLHLFLIVMLGLNVLLILQHSFAIAQPDVSEAGLELMDALKDYDPGTTFLYADAPTLYPSEYYAHWPLDRKGRITPFNEFTRNYDPTIQFNVTEPTVLTILNFLGHDGLVVPAGCTLRQTFRDRGVDLGLLYTCEAVPAG